MTFLVFSLLLRRRVRTHRPGPRGVAAGEGPGRPDGVREDPVPQPASALRTPAAASAGPARRPGQPHLPALLHAAGGQDPHRDADPGHAAVRELHQLALHVGTVRRAEAGPGLGGGGVWNQTPEVLSAFRTVTFGRSRTKAAFRETETLHCRCVCSTSCLSGLCSICPSHPVKKEKKKPRKNKHFE